MTNRKNVIKKNDNDDKTRKLFKIAACLNSSSQTNLAVELKNHRFC